MKRLALSMTILGVAWWLWTVRTIHASNDRYIVAQFTNGTSQEPGGANATLDLTVFNDIRNLSYPNHFIQWIQVTVPAGFTGSGAGGAFVSSDFIPPAGWSVSSIAGNVITFISASTNYTFNAGQSRTFLLKVHTPTATACPGTTYAFPVLGNQSTNGGNGNTYKYRPGVPLATVAVTNCVTPTYLVLNSVQPNAILTTGSSQTVTLTATLTTLAGHDPVGNPIPGAPLQNEPLTFTEGGLAITTCQAVPQTNSSGIATCTYTPLTGPITPLVAGNYDDSASFAGDSVPFPPYGGSNSSTKQLTVNATATSLTVADASGPYGGSVTLTATLASGAGQTGVSGQTITFYLNGSSVGSASTNNSGVATLNNVSIAGIAGGTYPAYISATFAADAITNYAQLVVTPVGQTITFNGPGDQAFPNGSVGISATDSVSLLVTFTSNTTNICTVGTDTLNGSMTSATVSFVSIGQCSITASQSGNSSYGAATPVTQTFNIGNAAMTCTLANMSVIYTGLEQSPTCSTNVAGVSCKANNAPQISPGSYPENAVSLTAGYTCSGPASSGTFIINKATPTITVTGPGSVTYGNTGTATYTLTSGDTGSVSFSAGSSTGCSVSGTTVSVTNASGTCSLTASVTADSNYAAATSTPFSVTLNKATPTITVTGPDSVTYGSTGTATSTLTSGDTGTVTFSAGSSTGCSVSGTTVSVTDASGTCSLTASVTTDNNYTAATSAPFSVSLNKATPTITVTGPGSVTYGSTGTATYTLTSGDTGTVTFSAGSSSGCSVSGTTVSVTNASSTCSLTASVTADSNYTAATSAAFLVTLNKALALVIPSNLIQTYTGSSLQPSVATAPAGLSLTYTGSDSLPRTDVGSYNVGWAINDNNYYGSYSGTFQITGAAQSITFQSFIVAATSTSGGPVTFSSGDPNLCTVTATDPATNQAGQYTAVVTLAGSNTDWTKCTVLANQAGNDNYKPAAPATAILGNPNP